MTVLSSQPKLKEKKNNQMMSRVWIELPEKVKQSLLFMIGEILAEEIKNSVLKKEIYYEPKENNSKPRNSIT